MNSQNSWKDIPPEVVDEVLGYCDKSSLLVLSRVNHQLNFLTLSRYFAPKIKGRSAIYLSSGLPIRLLRIAFFLPATIQHIDYRPEYNTEYQQYLNELRELTEFIAKMPKILSLRSQYLTFKDHTILNAQTHHEVWARLLAVASLKGCEDLTVEEKGCSTTHAQQLSSPRPSKDLGFSGLRHASTPFCKRRSSLSPQSEDVVQSSLRKIELVGRSLLNSSFELCTLLTQHATSITHLSLTELDIRGFENAKNLMFDDIHFTALQLFKLKTSFSSLSSPTLVLNFLRRHPYLVNLILGARIWQAQGPVTPEERLSWYPPPQFPNLRDLEMYSEDFEWLVPDFCRCPNLKSISLIPRWTNEPQNGIISILNNLHASPSMNSPLEMKIWIPFRDINWMSQLHHADETSLMRWSRVKKLVIYESSTISRLAERLPSVSVDWISRFSSLEQLELGPITRKVREELGESLAARCPSLSPKFAWCIVMG